MYKNDYDFDEANRAIARCESCADSIFQAMDEMKVALAGAAAEESHPEITRCMEAFRQAFRRGVDARLGALRDMVKFMQSRN